MRREPNGLLENVGGTPLFGFARLASELPPGVELYAKAEHLNPGGSVKDRAALSMILEGERSGRLSPGKISSTRRAETPASHTR